MIGIKVLVAEDETVVRYALAQLLDAEDDIDVVGEAPDGELAVALARQSRPDVVLMDLRMPRMDGFETIVALRDSPATADIPIIAISAWDNVKNEERALALGANRCIVKPFDPDEVMRAINACTNVDRTT